MFHKNINDHHVIVVIVILTTLIIFSTVFLVTGMMMSIVYGEENKKYTDCVNYKLYSEFKGISGFEADYNTSAVDERIAAIQLGQDPFAKGPAAQEELVCLQEIRAAEQEEIRYFIGPADIDQMIESNEQQLALLEKRANEIK